MAKAGVIFTKDNEYYTPKIFVEQFGKFDYDPATTKEKAAEFGIENFDTIETDGLAADWTKYKRIWINPPFTIKHEFLKKAVETFNQTKADIYILFPIEFITTKRFHDILGPRGGGNLCAKWKNQIRKWARQKSKLAGVWELRHENSGYFYDYPRKDKAMIRAVSFHAIERLQQRRGCVHLLRHLNKVQKWNAPTNGIVVHKGYKYIIQDGILVTVYPDKATWKTRFEQDKKKGEKNVA